MLLLLLFYVPTLPCRNTVFLFEIILFGRTKFLQIFIFIPPSRQQLLENLS